MNVSRGGFLKICGAVLLGRTADASSLLTVVGGAFAPSAGGGRVPFRMEHATAALFQPHLNTTFAVGSAAGTRLPLVLAGVTQRPVSRGVEQFSLSFRARPGAPVLHGTHAFQHPALGAFDLFIAPVGSGKGTVYEACFSRHVATPASTAEIEEPPHGRR